MLDREMAALTDWLRRVTVEIKSGPAEHGAGVVWRSDGLIVTNAHVATRPGLDVRLADGRVLPGRVIRRDPACDLAIIQVPARELPAAEPRRSARAGELIVAVGHPLGIAGAIAVGVVHAVPSGGPRPVDRLLRMDLRLAPGNSGGPVADVTGRVLGVNTLIAQGLAHAVPSALIEQFVQQVRGERAA